MVTDEQADRRLREALDSPEARTAVPELAVVLKSEGFSQVQLYRLYVKYQQELSGEDPRYDFVVDTLDRIWGGPWAKGGDLFEVELSEARLQSEPTGGSGSS